MKLGKVIGTVVSTSKDERLIGCKLLVVQVLDEHLEKQQRTEISVDTVGAGAGEIVILAHGSSAKLATGNTSIPIDSAIIGIVDTVEISE